MHHTLRSDSLWTVCPLRSDYYLALSSININDVCLNTWDPYIYVHMISVEVDKGNEIKQS